MCIIVKEHWEEGIHVEQTANPYRELDAIIDALPERRGALISVLHRAQQLYGYLPRELQLHIAQRMGIPASKVFGVVTFYSFLKTSRPGRHPISVCMGTACFVRGAEAVLREFEKEIGIAPGGVSEDGLFSLESIRCVGACGLAPVVRVGERVYGRVQPGEVKSIVDDCMVKEEMAHGKA